MKFYALFFFSILIFTLTGCGSSGTFITSNSTDVQLREGNYRIVAINVSGSAESAYMFGVSHSWGITTQSFGLIPLKGSGTLYKDARENLWETFKKQNTSVEGRSLALVNVQHDADTINYLFYTKAKVSITADVIEFE